MSNTAFDSRQPGALFSRARLKGYLATSLVTVATALTVASATVSATRR